MRAGSVGRGVGFLGGLFGAYVLVVRGALTLDLGIGRRTRKLGPIRAHIEADPDTVFDVIAAPYLQKTPRALEDKLQVIERGSDLVLASHFTPVAGRLHATTVEVVRFERPRRINFRLVRGPVPHVTETFELEPSEGAQDRGDRTDETRDESATAFCYSGELGTDLWGIGGAWGGLVARSWERAVAESVARIKEEAERLAAARRRHGHKSQP